MIIDAPDSLGCQLAMLCYLGQEVWLELSTKNI